MPEAKSGVSEVAPWHGVVEQGGNLYLTNGVDDPFCLPGPSDAPRNWGIEGPTSAPTLTTSAGSLTNTSGNTYTYYYAYYNKKSGKVSNPSPVSSAVALSSNKVLVKVSHSVPDSQVTHKRIFRNTDGQAITYYTVADISASANSYQDTNSDDVISVKEIMRTDNDPPGKTMPYVTWHNGRMHLYGSRVERLGSVTVTSGSTDVTGSGTQWRPSHVGQTLVVSGDTACYIVASVSSDTGLKLTENYVGSTKSGASYRLFPASDRSKWSWSRAGEPEYFPAANTDNIFENDADDPTGFVQAGSQLFAAKRRHLYALVYSTDPSPATGDGGIFARLKNRGLVNQRCAVEVDGVAYLMDERGFYVFDGATTAQPIDQAINRLVNIDATEQLADRVNWSRRERFHGFYDSKRHRVVWFVCLGSDSEPRHAMVYDITSSRWVLEEYRQGITASCVMEDSTGRLRQWVGDENGYIWAYGVSRSRDGAPSTGTLTGTLTNVSGLVLTDSQANFYTTGSGLDGVPVYMETGSAAGQWGIIDSNTTTALTLKTALSPNATIGDQYVVGAVEMHLRTRWFSLSDPSGTKRIGALRVYFERSSTAQDLLVRIYKDWSSSPFTEWRSSKTVDGFEVPSTAETDGVVKAHMNTVKGFVEIPIGTDFANWVRFDFRWIGSNAKPRLLGYEWLMQPQPGTKKFGG